MCWSWKARAFAFGKVYRSRTHRPDRLHGKEVAQFFISGWLTILLTFTRSPRKPGICHFSSDIEVRLNIVLPGLPLLDALFADPQRRIHVHGLITVKNSSAI